MPANNNWWIQQLFENLKEASIFYERFKFADEPNIDDLDRAMEIFEAYVGAYEEIKNFEFNDFIEIGKSLRTRQALPKRATNYEYNFTRL